MLTFFNELYFLSCFLSIFLLCCFISGPFAQWKEFVSNVNVPKSIQHWIYWDVWTYWEKIQKYFHLINNNLHCVYFLPFYIKKTYFPGKVNCLFDLLVNSVSHTYGKFTTICFQKFIFFPYFMQKNIFLLHKFHKNFFLLSALKSAQKLSRHRFLKMATHLLVFVSWYSEYKFFYCLHNKLLCRFLTYFFLEEFRGAHTRKLFLFFLL